jgi:hypothetical protein
MANLDASTPQLKVLKKAIDAVTALDLSKMDTLLSRNFKYQSFPKTIDVPEQTKGTFFQWFRGVFASMSKFEVCIQRWRPPSSSQADIHPQPIIHEMIDAPGKIVIHVRPSIKLSQIIIICHDAGHSRILPRRRYHVRLR